MVQSENEPMVWTCICKKVLTVSKGYTNQVAHIKAKHPGWEQVFLNQEQASCSSSSLCVEDKRSLMEQFMVPVDIQAIFFWLDWIVRGLHPFSFVASNLNREKARQAPISINTLKKYMHLLCKRVEKDISSILPSKFALVIDGWSSDSTHYWGLFASFLNEKTSTGTELVLLGFSPPIDESDLSSQSMCDFIDATLKIYGKDRKNIVTLTADNTNVNPATATLIGCKFVGCASHRLNLAVKKYLEDFDHILNKVNNLMLRLQQVKPAARLRERTVLRAKTRCQTRWSGTFMMLKRYFQIKESLDPMEPLWYDLLPTPLDNVRLESLMNSLDPLHEAVLLLQSDNITLADVRFILDEVIQKLDSTDSNIFSESIGINATIIRNKTFESACVNLLLDGQLSAPEIEEVDSLRISTNCDIILSNIEDRERNIETLAERLESERKRRKVSPQSNVCYLSPKFILPTSNCCERFFSKAGYVLNRRRRGILPINLEAQLFLNVNHRYWNLKSFHQAICESENENIELSGFDSSLDDE
jgi:hypothetical protein